MLLAVTELWRLVIFNVIFLIMTFTLMSFVLFLRLFKHVFTFLQTILKIKADECVFTNYFKCLTCITHICRVLHISLMYYTHLLGTTPFYHAFHISAIHYVYLSCTTHLVMHICHRQSIGLNRRALVLIELNLTVACVCRMLHPLMKGFSLNIPIPYG